MNDPGQQNGPTPASAQRAGRPGEAHGETAAAPADQGGPGRVAGSSLDAGLEKRLVERLRGAVGTGPTACALGGTVRVGVRDGRVQLRAASRFGADLAERRYLALVRPIVRDELGRADAEIEIVIDPTVAEHRRPPGPAHAGSNGSGAPTASGPAQPVGSGPAPVAAPGRSSGISGPGPSGSAAASPRPRARAAAHRVFRFEDFVVGPSNRLAYNAAASLACDDETAVAARLLVLHGPCGVGKTHLLRAISHAFASARGERAVRTVTAEGFTNEYVESVRTGRIEAFRKRYRSIGLLCIDDVHFVAAKAGTQSELMHTLDQLNLRGSRVVLVSDEHPRLIKQLSAPLRSRFSSGAVVGLDPPDDELCAALIERFARERGMAFTAQAIGALVSRARAESGGDAAGASPEVGARELKGLVLQVEATLNSTRRGGPGAGPGPAARGEPIGAATVEQALAQRERHRASAHRRPVRVREIAEVVCAELGVEAAELAGRGRHRRVVLARSVASYLAKKLTTRSYPEIAMDLGRRTHSTVLAACRRIERQIADGTRVEVGCEHDGLTVSDLVSRIEQRLRVRP